MLKKIIIGLAVVWCATLPAMALPVNTVVLGSKAYSVNALMQNAPGIQQALNSANGKFYLSIDGVKGGAFFDLFKTNLLMTAAQKTELGAMTYVDYVGGQFTTTNYSGFDTVAQNAGYSRDNPAGVGAKLTYSFDSDKYTANVTMLELLRGNAAWQKIQNASAYNDPAPVGKEYVVAKFDFELVKSPDQYFLYDLQFDLISQAGKEYNDDCYVTDPEPSLYSHLYQGAQHQGYVVYLCDIADIKPVIAFKRDYNGLGGIWFKGY